MRSPSRSQAAAAVTEPTAHSASPLREGHDFRVAQKRALSEYQREASPQQMCQEIDERVLSPQLQTQPVSAVSSASFDIFRSMTASSTQLVIVNPKTLIRHGAGKLAIAALGPKPDRLLSVLRRFPDPSATACRPD